MSEPDLGKTQLKRLELYRDRWTSYGSNTGIETISEKLGVEQLKEYEIFAGLDDRFLERISPDVSLAIWKDGSVIFDEGSYIDLAFFIIAGEIEVFLKGIGPRAAEPSPIFDLNRTVVGSAPAPQVDETAGQGTRFVPASRPRPAEITFLATMDFDLPAGESSRLGAGEYFGEIGALSGWPQAVTTRAVGDCRLLQIRVSALRLLRRKSKALKVRLDEIYRKRSLSSQLKNTPIFRGCTDMFIDALKETVELVSCEPDEVVVAQGEPADALYVVRSGFVKLAQRFGEGDMVVTYLSKGMTLGEVELLVNEGGDWESTALSVEYSELVKIPQKTFAEILRTHPEVGEQLWQTAVARIKEAGLSRRNVGHSEFVQVALDTGLVQGSSILAIDLDQCTRCDDCVRACAATHDGLPRFIREGNKYGNLLIAKSCYHCRDPVCLVGCPTGAIHRAGVADVVEISPEVCIGCSSCANNCPYDAIVMHDTGEKWPADMVPEGLRNKDRMQASKCDLCHDTGHGPACVSNCPQGCAYRVGSVEEFEKLLTVKV